MDLRAQMFVSATESTGFEKQHRSSNLQEMERELLLQTCREVNRRYAIRSATAIVPATLLSSTIGTSVPTG